MDNHDGGSGQEGTPHGDESVQEEHRRRVGCGHVADPAEQGLDPAFPGGGAAAVPSPLDGIGGPVNGLSIFFLFD